MLARIKSALMKSVRENNHNGEISDEPLSSASHTSTPVDPPVPLNVNRIQEIDVNAANMINASQLINNLDEAIRELIENAMDAKADCIDIRLKKKGLIKIEVLDNGVGIPEHDFQNLAEANSTSKIAEAGELKDVKTYGFRGMALHNFALFSRLSIVTRNKDVSVGSQIEISSTPSKKIKRKARLVGTTVIVENLFERLPVRRNELFDKLDDQFTKTMYSVQAYSLSHPNIKFTLTNDGKTVLTSGGGDNDVKSILNQLFRDVDFKEFEGSKPGSDVLKANGCSGFASKALDNYYKIHGFYSFVPKNSVKKIEQKFFFINGRHVEIKSINKITDKLVSRSKLNLTLVIVLFVDAIPQLINVSYATNKREVGCNYDKILDAIYQQTLSDLIEEKKSHFAPLRVDSTTTPVYIPQKRALLVEPKNDINDAAFATPKRRCSQRLLKAEVVWDMPEQSVQTLDIKQDVNMFTPIENLPTTSASFPSVISSQSDTFDSQLIDEEDFMDPAFVSYPKVHRIYDLSDDDDVDECDVTPVADVEENLNAFFVRHQAEPVDFDDIENRLFQDGSNFPDYTSIPGWEDNTLSKSKEDDYDDILCLTAKEKLLLSNELSKPKKSPYPAGVDPSDALINFDFELDNYFCDDGLYSDGVHIKDIYEDKFAHYIDPEVDSLLAFFQTLEAVEFVDGYTYSGGSAGFDSDKNQLAADIKLSKSDFALVTPHWQFNKGFILCTHKNGLFIVDQHAADEKYHYEKLFNNVKVASQPLMVPFATYFSAIEYQVIMMNLDYLKSMKFKIHPMTNNKVLLLGVPSYDGKAFSAKELHSLVGYLVEYGNGEHWAEEMLDAWFASRACHTAVKIGDALESRKIKEILGHLSGLKHPWNCPHGRPTVRLYRTNLPNSIHFIHASSTEAG